MGKQIMGEKEKETVICFTTSAVLKSNFLTLWQFCSGGCVCVHFEKKKEEEYCAEQSLSLIHI